MSRMLRAAGPVGLSFQRCARDAGCNRRVGRKRRGGSRPYASVSGGWSAPPDGWALEGSRATFIQALALDGAAGSLEAATALADDLLAAQAAYVSWA